MDRYDTVFLGFPIWWYVEPRIVDTFMEACDIAGKTFIPFATSGGSGVEGAGAQPAKGLPAGAVESGQTPRRRRGGLGPERRRRLNAKGVHAMMKSQVYFTREIAPESVVAIYHKLGVELPGRVAVKVHTGELGNQNFLRPEFWRPMVEEVKGTVVECNTAYGDATGGVRDHTDTHRKLLAEHGWTKYFDVDIMDAEGPDVIWPIPNGKVLRGKPRGQAHPPLRLHARARPLQRPSRGRLRRGAEAAGHRLRLQRRQGR